MQPIPRARPSVSPAILRIGASLPLLGLLAACAGEETPAPTDSAPTAGHVAALSTYSARVGTLIEAYGTNFPGGTDRSVSLRFDGTFTTESGAIQPVHITTPAKRLDTGTLRWTGFGPYNNPFSQTGEELGRYEGTVAARVTLADGTVLEDPEPTPIEIEVLPSLLVKELQPTTAQCSGGVLRALGGAPYRVRVTALGFDPVAIQYSFTAPGINQVSPIQVRTLVNGKSHEIGARGDFMLPDVPAGVPSYGAVMTISAKDRNGRTYDTAFGLTVHRPIEVFYNGNVEVGEVLAPAPVSGCIPGGINGRSVEYSEAESETRSRSFDVSWNQSWLTAHTVSVGSEQTVGLSETNGVGFATTDGQSFSWKLGTEIGGTFGLDELVSLGVKANTEEGTENSRSVESSRNRESGVNASSTTTETESVDEQNQREVGGGFSWNVSSSQEISRGFSGDVIANTYGVFYRQTLRLVRRAAVVAYNQCGYAQVVGDVDFIDWTWSPDLAIGPSCPPLPKSNLPPAQCSLPPCSGG